MSNFSASYDIVVVGGGHAGIEAAFAAVRLGCSTLLLTQNLDTIGQMSCNPAIGGLAKGHIVREIDALGGFMGRNADATGIQFRMLNRSRGISVRAPRAQCDKKAYQSRAKRALEECEGLEVKQAAVIAVRVDNDHRVTGVETDIGLLISARAVVITSGTFLGAILHVGDISKPGGRMGDAVSGLSGSLRQLGVAVGRFKTGTPCRLNSRSIDFSACEIQVGDVPPPRFSYLLHRSGENDTAGFHVEQLPCWITHTTSKTHDIIRQNLQQSPFYSGRIEGVGPRYCPSIEDKVVKFSEKLRHQLFLEPEGRETHEIYVNGVSTSLPYPVQLEFIRTIPGLRNAEIMRPGYAVEYDYFPPTQLMATLESKVIGGVFFAGQVNGTSGYEEAAAQGLIAGANAALALKGAAPLILSRRDAYIGVLVDDLVTKGVNEPYRMFTSRSEDRLSLRQDNADQRLTPIGQAVGLVDQERWEHFRTKIRLIDSARHLASTTIIGTTPLSHLLKHPQFNQKNLPADVAGAVPAEVWEIIEADYKNEGYVRRQESQNRHLASRDCQPIPDGFDFSLIQGLRAETRQKLGVTRPTKLGDAARVSGVTPADVAIISVWLAKQGTPSAALASS